MLVCWCVKDSAVYLSLYMSGVTPNPVQWYTHFYMLALGIRNALQSIEPSIQVRFLYILPCSIHCATHTTHQNTEEMLGLYLAQA